MKDFTVSDALAIAVLAFGNRMDKSGKELAVYHSIRMAMAVEDPIDQMIALLHDVVEDTHASLEDLRTFGVPEEVVTVVDEVTRRENVQYFDYIRNIKSKRGIRLKLNDNADNYDRLDTLPDVIERNSMANRYRKSVSILLQNRAEVA